jgi:CMP-N-acetylneuraminic acid synthetase
LYTYSICGENNLKYVALICARSGSKGVSEKNIKPLGGIPLICWSIKHAKQVKKISRVIVSTDSEEIAQIARSQGAETPFIRPKEYAQDNTPEWLVWRHMLDYLDCHNYEIDGLVIVPPTAPLREVHDINKCINDYENGGVDIVVTVTDAQRNPYFNMVSIDERGYSSLVIPQQDNISRRQDAPEVFDMTTVAYVVRPQFVYDHGGIFEGKVRSVYIPPERALDIDTILDFKIAEYMISSK